MAGKVGGIAQSATSLPQQEELTYLFCLYHENGVFHPLALGKHVLTNSAGDFQAPSDNIIRISTECNEDFVLHVLVRKHARLCVVVVKGSCCIEGQFYESSDNLIKLRLGGELVLGGERFMFSTRKDKDSPLLKRKKIRRLPSLPQTTLADVNARPTSPNAPKVTNNRSPFQYLNKVHITRSYSFNLKHRKLPTPPTNSSNGKFAASTSKLEHTRKVSDKSLEKCPRSSTNSNTSLLSNGQPPRDSTECILECRSSEMAEDRDEVDSGCCRLSFPHSTSGTSGWIRDSVSSYGEVSLNEEQTPGIVHQRPRANTWAPTEGKLSRSQSFQFHTQMLNNIPASSSHVKTSHLKRHSVLGFTPGSLQSTATAPAIVDFYKKRRRDIAQELCETEEKYVARLKLIAVDFRQVIIDLNQPRVIIPEVTVKCIFLNIESIYSFHQELLRSLRNMLDKWGDEREELGLVLFQLAPFLKLYVHYISKFDSATKALTELSKKDKKFEAALKKFEASPACASLSVSNHMLEPVQRIPRYRMLLVDYLKHLPSDSQDYKPSIKALELISEAADRANDEIKHFENLNQVLSIQRSLQDYNDPLVTPGRTFLKKGKLYKSAGKTTHLKMFFLFSDILIYANIVAGGNYKCKNVLPILGMKVFGQQFTHGSLAFHVISKTRSLTLFAQNEAEKQEWVEALEAAINDSRARKKSFRRRSTVVSINDRWFGVHSPVMLPCDSASRCMQCDAAFSFRNRKNNCKACGKVVCSHCSKHKTYLLYKGKEDKVCVNCFDKANAHGLSDIVAPSGPPDDLTPPQVDPFESEVIYEGHLLYQLTDGNDWEKFWFQLKSNCVLYKFTDIENVQTLDEVVSLSDCEVDQDEGTIITLTHSKGSFRVKTLEEGDAERWMQSITRAKDISSTFTLSL